MAQELLWSQPRRAAGISWVAHQIFSTLCLGLVLGIGMVLVGIGLEVLAVVVRVVLVDFVIHYGW